MPFSVIFYDITLDSSITPYHIRHTRAWNAARLLCRATSRELALYEQRVLVHVAPSEPAKSFCGVQRDAMRQDAVSWFYMPRALA